MMRLLLLTLLLLSGSVHLIIVFFFPHALTFQSSCIAFVPAYITLFSSYLLLSNGQKKLSIHVFLLGMVIAQMLVVVFLTGPAAYVFVSYTNVVLLSGLILGPLYAVLYTLLIVCSISIYFYAAQHDLVTTELIDGIDHGPELILLATIACFVFTSTSVSYFVLKMSALYRSILSEKEKSNITLQKLEKLQKTNELRIHQGNAIGGLGKQLVQIEQTQQFLQVASDEVLQVLKVDLVVILVSTVEGHMIRGLAVKNQAQSYRDLVGEIVITPQKIWKQPSSNQPSPLFLNSLLSGELLHYRELNHIQGVRIFESDNNMGAILVGSVDKVHEQKTFLTAVASIVSSALCRETAEENLRQYQKMETLGLLAGGIAHDFNNLLMTIVGNTELALRKTTHKPDVARLLNQISWASNQATSLTHKLLSFSQKSSFAPDNIDINLVLQEMIPILQQAFVGRIQLDIQYADTPAWIIIDRKDFETALLNLVLNAKDAIKDQGNVGISVAILHTKNQQRVLVQVQDNGIGIAPDVLSKVFEPFFTTKSTGTGLGLTMVRSVVERAEGDLTVESTSEGSSFFLEFPMRSPTYQPEMMSPTISKPRLAKSNQRKKILVVEDDPFVRAALVEMLEEGGYQTLEADSGNSAFQKIAEQDVDMILSDIHMPGKGGAELYQQVLEISPGMPFLFMTGYNAELEAHDLPILEKPISLQDLLHRVDEGLRRSV